MFSSEDFQVGIEIVHPSSLVVFAKGKVFILPLSHNRGTILWKVHIADGIANKLYKWCICLCGLTISSPHSRHAYLAFFSTFLLTGVECLWYIYLRHILIVAYSYMSV